MGEAQGHPRIDFVRRDGRAGNVTVDQFQRILGFKGQMPHQHLVKGCAERVKVGAIVNDAIHASGLFRRHVSQGAFKTIGVAGFLSFGGKAGGKPQVDQLNHLSFRVEEDIGWFDIFMNDLVVVQFPQTLSNLEGNGKKMINVLTKFINEVMNRITAKVFKNEAENIIVAL